MPNKAKTHEECRKSVCFLCMRKGDRELNDFIIGRIHKLLKTDIDFADERVPQAICNACRTLLQKRDAGDMSVSLPAIYNFSAIIVKPLTRTSGPCDCLICQITKLKLNQKHPLAPKEQNRNLDQGESSKPGPSPKSRLQSSEKRCAQCLSILARGFRHSCTIGTRHQNLQALVQSDPVGAEQIASAIISSKDASPGGTVRLSQARGGQLFPLTPGPASAHKSTSSTLTMQSLLNVQLNTGLSNTGMRQLASTLSKATETRLVEPFFQQKFAAVGKSLNDFF
ncbi:uncharacterized protein LOC136090361 [Hydra vulgaris]|uniref:Uncharacterized protein LOC136090361 n=1 Tax=Hydra vulgaris TaxID=6087 RepID=A0ABM4DF40_HYDVU